MYITSAQAAGGKAADRTEVVHPAGHSDDIPKPPAEHSAGEQFSKPKVVLSVCPPGWLLAEPKADSSASAVKSEDGPERTALCDWRRDLTRVVQVVIPDDRSQVECPICQYV